MKKKKSIGFSLRKITTEQFAVIEDVLTEDKNFGLEAKLNYKVNKENKIIAVITTFRFINNDKPFIIIEIGCHFKIEEEAWESFKKEDKIKILKDFMSHLAMITVGTARGALHAKTEGTPFNKYIIPTINVADLIKEDVEF